MLNIEPLVRINEFMNQLCPTITDITGCQDNIRKFVVAKDSKGFKATVLAINDTQATMIVPEND
jgi:hypothetical protein